MLTCFRLIKFFCLTLILLSTISNAKNLDQSVVEIADDIYSFSTNGEYISMFVITNNSVLVFETMNSHHAKAMVSKIKQITKKPIKFAFHSHNHWDHSSGGKVFLDEGASTVAHAEAAAWMKANPYKDMVAPTKIWSGNLKKFDLGGVQVELHYFGMNHGLGMTVFYLPQSKIAYIADIVTPKRIIFTVAPDFNLREWERSLTEVLKLDFDQAVYSHNEHKKPLHQGNKADVQSQLEYLRDLRFAFYAELKKGTNPILIPGIIKLPKYENWVGYNDWLAMNVWRVLTDEFMGPFPWRPETK
ncbi:MAG: MBL fold metallo-hydrolase [Colwellia sp.]|nr:MBL fold metallo-hydrolase [Colwellia sp.]